MMRRSRTRKIPVQEEQEPDVEQVLFQGPLYDRECNLKANAKLVQVALVPVKQMISDALARRAIRSCLNHAKVASQFGL